MSDVQMDYEAVEAMSRLLANTAQQFDELRETLNQMADNLENGVLLGASGEALVHALRGTLAQQVARGAAKMRELSSDVNRAMQDMQDGDQAGAQQFS